MIGFVIPFKSRLRSKNWALDCALLSRTLHSLLNQTSKSFRCYVVYSDLPDAPVQHHKLVWIPFPFPFLESSQIEDEELFLTRYGLGKFLPNFFDQGKRILYGTSFARKEGCTYIMSVDADDLLSNKVAAFVENNGSPRACGWYVNKGYMYAENSSFLLKVPEHMNYVCASVNIIRTDLVPEPDFGKKTYNDFQFFSSHAYLADGIKDYYNKELQPVPFYGTTYVLHQGNFFTDSRQITKINFRNILKRVIRGKYLGRQARKEFGIYNLVA